MLGGVFLPVALIWATFVTYHSFCNIYKRFNSSDEEDEAGTDVFSVPTKKTPLDSLRKTEGKYCISFNSFHGVYMSIFAKFTTITAICNLVSY